MTVKKFLLIDSYLNETRVAIVKDSILEDFDDELPANKLKKGSIYIGRVMRIESSLQAAFLDFGFEKHGFLAFSEIRPHDLPPATAPAPKIQENDPTDPANPEVIELYQGEEARLPLRPLSQIGKIHDLIKRQELVMVQVIKDERGSKGAALTTYISLTGRYGFFLPNTPKSSGISEKVTDPLEREALKKILTDLEVPEGMSFILRSASMGRKKSEIKRDYDFLMEKWNKIAATPLESVGEIYAEESLLIRALRDLYSSDIQEVIIQGEDSFKLARAYVRKVFPSHAKKITLHKDPIGLFQKFKIEAQIESIYEHTVNLPSGGSIVINPTEALVSIDVNSSKSTKERSIEETALKTNLEASLAIGRNLRLRDLAGLIVIDFIDLHPNKRPLVEKALKDALAMDRARLKIGKISEFGLLEMSRQRLRQSLMETNTHPCPTCHGAGRMLSLPMQSMRALRILERSAANALEGPICGSGTTDLVLCLLNDHRKYLSDIEKKWGKTIHLTIDKDSASHVFHITSPTLAIKGPEEPVIAENKRHKKPHRHVTPAQKTLKVIPDAKADAPTPQILAQAETTLMNADNNFGSMILLPTNAKTGQPPQRGNTTKNTLKNGRNTAKKANTHPDVVAKTKTSLGDTPGVPALGEANTFNTHHLATPNAQETQEISLANPGDKETITVTEKTLAKGKTKRHKKRKAPGNPGNLTSIKDTLVPNTTAPRKETESETDMPLAKTLVKSKANLVTQDVHSPIAIPVATATPLINTTTPRLEGDGGEKASKKSRRNRSRNNSNTPLAPKGTGQKDSHTSDSLGIVALPSFVKASPSNPPVVLKNNQAQSKNKPQTSFKGGAPKETPGGTPRNQGKSLSQKDSHTSDSLGIVALPSFVKASPSNPVVLKKKPEHTKNTPRTSFKGDTPKETPGDTPKNQGKSLSQKDSHTSDSLGIVALPSFVKASPSNPPVVLKNNQAQSKNKPRTSFKGGAPKETPGGTPRNQGKSPSATAHGQKKHYGQGDDAGIVLLPSRPKST